MKSFDFEAVVYDCDVYCVECLPQGVDVDDEDEVSPIFADGEWDYYPVCVACNSAHTYVSLTEKGREAERLAFEATKDPECPPGCEKCEWECHLTDEALHEIDPTFVCRRSLVVDGWEVSIDVSTDALREGFLRVVVEVGGVGPHAKGVAGGVMRHDTSRGAASLREQVLAACHRHGWFLRGIGIAESRDPAGAACAHAIQRAHEGDRSMMN